MNNQKIMELAQSLQGISYAEWKKLQMIVDTAFRQKKSEMEKELHLTSLDDLQKAIRSLFG